MLHSSTRLPTRLGLLAVCMLLAALAAFSASAQAASTKSCGSATLPSLAGGYIYQLKVKGTSCSTGRKVQVAFQKCRLKHGVSGRCTAKVDGFSCKESKRNVALDNFFSAVTCKKGSARVTYAYQQNTIS
jgi:hypothetical protein